MPVLSELATMTEVAQGTSLARFGDGELLIMGGLEARYQKASDKLANELRGILNDSPCLIGVPHTRNDLDGYWEGMLRMYGGDINSTKWYGSSFVSRADWMPWSSEFLVQLHWVLDGRNPIIVAPEDYPTGKFGDGVTCASENAYDYIDDIEATISGRKPDPAILCCGPTATVLADRLARKGIWAVDLGNFGKFL